MVLGMRTNLSRKARLARIMHEEWNTDRIVDVEKHDCDEWQNLP
jgi:hypothetical protein